MTPARKQMQRALTAVVAPQLRRMGFSGRFPHFRRVTRTEHHIITIFFSKYGGSFYVEGGRLSKTEYAAKRNLWKEHGNDLPEDKLTVGICSDSKRRRFGAPEWGPDAHHWFTFGPANGGNPQAPQTTAPASFYEGIAHEVAQALDAEAARFFDAA